MIKNKIYSNVIMQDLQTLEEIEKLEQSLNNIDLNETQPLKRKEYYRKNN